MYYNFILKTCLNKFILILFIIIGCSDENKFENKNSSKNTKKVIFDKKYIPIDTSYITNNTFLITLKNMESDQHNQLYYYQYLFKPDTLGELIYSSNLFQGYYNKNIDKIWNSRHWHLINNNIATHFFCYSFLKNEKNYIKRKKLCRLILKIYIKSNFNGAEEIEENTQYFDNIGSDYEINLKSNNLVHKFLVHDNLCFNEPDSYFNIVHLMKSIETQ